MPVHLHTEICSVLSPPTCHLIRLQLVGLLLKNYWQSVYFYNDLPAPSNFNQKLARDFVCERDGGIAGVCGAERHWMWRGKMQNSTSSALCFPQTCFWSSLLTFSVLHPPNLSLPSPPYLDPLLSCWGRPSPESCCLSSRDPSSQQNPRETSHRQQGPQGSLWQRSWRVLRLVICACTGNSIIWGDLNPQYIFNVFRFFFPASLGGGSPKVWRGKNSVCSIDTDICRLAQT